MGSGQCLGAILIIYCIQRIAQRLRRNILLHFGLGTFRIHFRETRKPLIFMVSDLLDEAMTPKTNYMWFGIHQDIFKNARKCYLFLGKDDLGHIKSSYVEIAEQFGKTGGGGLITPKNRSIVLEICSCGSNVQITLNGNLVRWCQSLPKKHWVFFSLELRSFEDFETVKNWKYGTLELLHFGSFLFSMKGDS